MNTQYTFAILAALSGVASAAVVTNPFVQNAPTNWSHLAGVTVDASSANVANERAIDGNYDGVWGNGSVTHSADNGDPNSWFQVDLGTARAITDITLYNRTDCCGGRLANYSVLASNDVAFGVGTTVYDSGNQGAAGATAAFGSVGATARYVRVQRNSLAPVGGGSVISLAEIDVIGQAFAFSNMALGSTATQSSTLVNSAAPSADKAIDGSTAIAFAAGSTTHTDPAASGAVFWETTFNSLTDINEIAIYNRGDCCPTRLSNFRVSIFNGVTEVWGENYFETANGGNAGAIFSIQEDTGGFIGTGDRVRIELIGGVNNASVADGGPNVLSLREVEIYGAAVPEPSSTALLALGGLALILRRRV
ncbi:MAG: discoidin domain-containing protein [Akkermansiaceae bacterium]